MKKTLVKLAIGIGLIGSLTGCSSVSQYKGTMTRDSHLNDLRAGDSGYIILNPKETKRTYNFRQEDIDAIKYK